MNIQNAVVMVMVLLACAYVGNMIWQKAKSTVKKGDCGSDCGCEGKSRKAETDKE